MLDLDKSVEEEREEDEEEEDEGANEEDEEDEEDEEGEEDFFDALELRPLAVAPALRDLLAGLLLPPT